LEFFIDIRILGFKGIEKGLKECGYIYYTKMPIADPEKRKEYLRQYYLTNKAKILENDKKKRLKIKDEKKALENEQDKKQKEDEKKQRRKLYKIQNKDRIQEYTKQYNDSRKEKMVEYRLNNLEKLKLKKKHYRLNNLENLRQYKIQYRLNNIEKIREADRERIMKNKCEHNRQKLNCKDCSIYSYLVNLQRSRVKQILKNKNIAKSQSTIEYLDCSPEYFKNYIQSKMIDGMTFDNIHIDHIKPACKFKLENPDELLKCCHYTNLQPLLIDDNLVKGGKWCDDDDLFWNENIIYKEYLPLYLPKNM
jgi:hypothetical protein